MKKLTLAILTATFALSAHAALSPQCKGELDNVVAKRQLTIEVIQSGDITSETSEFLLKGWDNVAEVTALTCAGIKKIELERSVAGRLGLVSQLKGNKIAEATFEEAMKYYKESIR